MDRPVISSSTGMLCSDNSGTLSACGNIFSVNYCFGNWSHTFHVSVSAAAEENSEHTPIQTFKIPLFFI